MPLTFLTQGRGHDRCTSERCMYHSANRKRLVLSCGTVSLPYNSKSPLG